MLKKARYVLAVNELESSVAFYEAKLGFKIAAVFEGWTFLARDSIVLMLGECKDEAPASSIGDHSYFAYIETDNAAALFQEFTSKGVTVIKSLTNEPWGMQEFGIQTPDGHRMMFGQDIDVITAGKS